jgi:uncharacterized membrane protein YgaE (UPF0421/DUF939 family)
VIGAIYLFYTLLGAIRGHYLAGSLTFIAWAISAFCLYLMSIRKYAWAYHITASLGIIFLYTFSLLYGEANSTHIFFMFIPVAALVLFDNFKICFVYFAITVIATITVKILFHKIPSYYPDEEMNKYLGYFNIFMTISLLYLAVRMFKYENLTYAKEINHQRDIIEGKQKEVMDSIHYAKRIQKALITNENYIEKQLKRLMKK